MRTLVIAGAVTVGLVFASPATGGCFATAGLELPSEGLEAGEVWTAKLTILQHGIRPMPEASPSVVIRDEETGARRVFRAKPVDSQGRYVARVVFPSSGSWALAVHDGFRVAGGESECAQTHTFGSVAVGGAPSGTASAAAAKHEVAAPQAARAPTSEADPFSVWWIVGVVFFVLVAGSVATVKWRHAKTPAVS